MVLKFVLLVSILLASCTLVDGEKPSDYESKPHRRGGSPGESSAAVLSSSSKAVSSSSAGVPSSSSVALSSSSVAVSSSSVAVPSSSSVALSSNSVAVSSSGAVVPSSSSVALSSSSAVVSSSSVAVSSSSAVVPSSSSVALSSSSVAVSSSSVAVQSGSCAGFIDGTTREHYGKNKAQFCDSRDGKKYVYVKINNQTWMAENLNYNASGSKCGNGTTLSNANTTTCDTHGRLYNWATAMADVCPSGWYLPSDAEWSALLQYADPDCDPPYTPTSTLCSNAGTKLKATSGWNDDGGGNGTDDYGFSALPGGYGGSGGNFSGVGRFGYWWSETEGSDDGAWSRYMSGSIVVRGNSGKTGLFSVRCVQ